MRNNENSKNKTKIPPEFTLAGGVIVFIMMLGMFLGIPYLLFLVELPNTLIHELGHIIPLAFFVKDIFIHLDTSQLGGATFVGSFQPTTTDLPVSSSSEYVDVLDFEDLGIPVPFQVLILSGGVVATGIFLVFTNWRFYQTTKARNQLTFERVLKYLSLNFYLLITIPPNLIPVMNPRKNDFGKIAVLINWPFILPNQQIPFLLQNIIFLLWLYLFSMFLFNFIASKLWRLWFIKRKRVLNFVALIKIRIQQVLTPLKTHD
ncbi:MAG: hypothetical protein ACFFBD_26060 [Candidatus Hodarchaeota archaeon]